MTSAREGSPAPVSARVLDALDRSEPVPDLSSASRRISRTTQFRPSSAMVNTGRAGPGTIETRIPVRRPVAWQPRTLPDPASCLRQPQCRRVDHVQGQSCRPSSGKPATASGSRTPAISKPSAGPARPRPACRRFPTIDPLGVAGFTIDQIGRVTTFEYDPSGNLHKVLPATAHGSQPRYRRRRSPAAR